MEGGGPERRENIVRFGGVHDGVVHQHHVELALQPQRPHVSRDVLAFRVDRAADGQHALRAIGQRQLEMRLEVRRQAASAGAELEQRRES